MNLEIMKMMPNENAIQFFRGIRNKFNEKWPFTGKGSTNRVRPLVSGTMCEKGPCRGPSVELSKRARNRNKRKQGFKSDYKGIWRII